MLIFVVDSWRLNWLRDLAPYFQVYYESLVNGLPYYNHELLVRLVNKKVMIRMLKILDGKRQERLVLRGLLLARNQIVQ